MLKVNRFCTTRNDHLHTFYAKPKIVQIGWGHHADLFGLKKISHNFCRRCTSSLHAGYEGSAVSSLEETDLTHWGRVTYICVSKVGNIGSDNGLPPGRRQAIIWTNAGILLIGPLGINFSEILIEIKTVSFNKCIWKCRLRNGVYFVSASMC